MFEFWLGEVSTFSVWHVSIRTTSSRGNLWKTKNKKQKQFLKREFKHTWVFFSHFYTGYSNSFWVEKSFLHKENSFMKFFMLDLSKVKQFKCTWVYLTFLKDMKYLAYVLVSVLNHLRDLFNSQSQPLLYQFLFYLFEWKMLVISCWEVLGTLFSTFSRTLHLFIGWNPYESHHFMWDLFLKCRIVIDFTNERVLKRECS